MTVTSPTPRRVKGPSWLDLRLVLGVLLVLGAVVAGAMLLGSAGRTTRVLAAKHGLAAGTVLRTGDLTWVQVRLPDRDRYLTSADAVAGRSLTRAVDAGELVPASALAHTPPRTTISVPLATGNAPPLRHGERIQLWLTTAACPSVVLIPEVVVQAVETSSGALSGDAGQRLTVSVTDAEAQRVVSALAIGDAVIRAGVLSGPAPASSAAAPIARCAASSSPGA